MAASSKMPKKEYLAFKTVVNDKVAEVWSRNFH